MDEYEKHIAGNKHLSSLAQTPLLLGMLLAVLPGMVQNNKEVGINDIYDAFMTQ